MKDSEKTTVSSTLKRIKDKFTKKFAKKPPFDPVDEASEQSFPASDPPAYSNPKH